MDSFKEMTDRICQAVIIYVYIRNTGVTIGTKCRPVNIYSKFHTLFHRTDILTIGVLIADVKDVMA